MDDGNPLLSSDFELASKENKNRHSTFEDKLNMHCYFLKT